MLDLETVDLLNLITLYQTALKEVESLRIVVEHPATAPPIAASTVVQWANTAEILYKNRASLLER